MADPAYSYQRPDQYLYNLLAGQGGLLPGVSEYYKSQFENLGGPDTSPFTYTGERIAGFSPREQYAMQLADQGVGSYQPYFQRAAGLTEDALATQGAGTSEAAAAMRRAQSMGEDYTRLGLDTLREGYRRGDRLTNEAARRLRDTASAQYDPSQAYKDYMDPYEDQVVQQAMKDIRESSAQGDIGRRAGEIGTGGFGGSRSRLTQAESERARDRGMLEAVSGIRSQGYQRAQEQGMAEFGRQQQARQAAAAGIGGLGQQRFGMASATGQGIGAGGQQLYGMGTGTGQGLAGLAGQLGAAQAAGAGQYQGYGTAMPGLIAGDVQSQLGIGGMNRARNQALMDLNYQNFVGQYNLPAQLFQGYGNFLTGAGPLLGGTGYSGPTAPTYTAAGAAGTGAASYGGGAYG
tara:strand:+ start:1614 stop:2825 length:1212 start_codon:yes stop_codon:yes gene_type:complete